MSIAKRAFNNIFWLFISQFCAKGMTFVAGVYLARILGAASFGLYSWAVAVSMYVLMVVDMGGLLYGIREVAIDKSRAEKFLCSLNSLQLAVATACLIIIAGVVFLGGVAKETGLAVLAASFCTVAYALSPDWMLKGLEKMEYIALADIFVGGFFLLTVIGLIKSPQDTVAALFYKSLSVLLGSIIMLAVTRKKLKIKFRLNGSVSEWWGHLKGSWYFAMNNGVFVFARYIPIFFLGFWASRQELGLFSASHRIIELIVILAAIIPQAIYPILSNLYATDKEKFMQTHSSFQKAMLYIGLPMGILGGIMSEELVLFLYGKSYLASVSSLRIMLVLVPLLFLRSTYGQSLISAGLQKLNFYSNIGRAVITIVMCVTLVPTLGGNGAAMAMVGGELVGLLIMAVIFHNKLFANNPLDGYLLKVGAACALTGFILSRINIPVLLKISSGIAIYGIFSFLFGIVSYQSLKKLYRNLLPQKI